MVAVKEDCELQEGDTPGVLSVPLGFLYLANNPTLQRNIANSDAPAVPTH